ncbi:MAG: endonuclease V [candidate division Zixibacteria bacterium]|nr:endonuclease V [candidate division Zixibacteria bacterium]
MDNFSYGIPHSWCVSLVEAKQIQERLSGQVILKDDFKKIEKIVGVGVVFSKREDEVFVGCASFSFPELKIQDTTSHKEKVNFPYTPGFFAFSAGSAILSAIKKIERSEFGSCGPDLIIFPGRGIAHPRGLGLASHLGVLLDLPTIACSKTPLWKDYPEPPLKKGANVFLEGQDKKLIGAVVRTREGKKPIFVTPGHKISIQTAVRVILQCSPLYRIPEPLRQAHILAKKMAETG